MCLSDPTFSAPLLSHIHNISGIDSAVIHISSASRQSVWIPYTSLLIDLSFRSHTLEI